MSRGSSGRLNRDIRRKAQWSIVVTTLKILQSAWPATVVDHRVTSKAEEDSITDVLRWKMVEAKERLNPMPRLRFSRESQSDRPQGDTATGLIDIMVSYTWNDRAYLTMECKRLTSVDNHLARKYVRNGIARFASGKYSAGHSYGIMVGYIICGNTKGCSERVRKTLENEPQSSSGFDAAFGWQSDNSVVKNLPLYRSRHMQKQFKNNIELLHAFMNVE